MLKFRTLQSWLPTGGLSTQLPQTNTAHQQAHRLMPRKFEGLESAMLLFCGGYGLLVAVLLLQAATLPMLLCFMLLGLGVLRWRFPSRSKLQWSIDALIAACIVAALFALPHSGGGSGPFLSLLLMFAVTFPLLMEASSAILFTGLLLAVYFSFGRNAAWVASPMLFAVRGVLIVGMCFLSARFGVVLRRSEESLEQLRRDVDSGAYNEHGWLRYGEPALKQCALQIKPFSLMYLNMPPDWAQQISEAKGFVSPHPHELRQYRAQALSEMAHCLAMALPSHCMVGRDANGDWVLLLPGMSSKDALRRVESHLGRPLQINFGPKSDEMFVCFMPCVVQAYEGESLQDLHARAADIWNRGVISGAV